MFQRALDEGRTVPIKIAAESHYEAQQTLFDLHQKYGSDLQIRVWDNSGTLSDLEERNVGAIRADKYQNLKTVISKAEQALDHVRQKYKNDPDRKEWKVERVFERIRQA